MIGNVVGVTHAKPRIARLPDGSLFKTWHHFPSFLQDPCRGPRGSRDRTRIRLKLDPSVAPSRLSASSELSWDQVRHPFRRGVDLLAASQSVGHDLPVPAEPVVVPHSLLVPSASHGLSGPDEGFRSEVGLRCGQAEEFVRKVQAFGGEPNFNLYVDVRRSNKFLPGY